jgi:hypothetical protein
MTVIAWKSPHRMWIVREYVWICANSLAVWRFPGNHVHGLQQRLSCVNMCVFMCVDMCVNICEFTSGIVNSQALLFMDYKSDYRVWTRVSISVNSHAVWWSPGNLVHGLKRSYVWICVNKCKFTSGVVNSQAIMFMDYKSENAEEMRTALKEAAALVRKQFMLISSIFVLFILSRNKMQKR